VGKHQGKRRDNLSDTREHATIKVAPNREKQGAERLQCVTLNLLKHMCRIYRLCVGWGDIGTVHESTDRPWKTQKPHRTILVGAKDVAPSLEGRKTTYTAPEDLRIIWGLHRLLDEQEMTATPSEVIPSTNRKLALGDTDQGQHSASPMSARERRKNKNVGMKERYRLAQPGAKFVLSSLSAKRAYVGLNGENGTASPSGLVRALPRLHPRLPLRARLHGGTEGGRASGRPSTQQ